MTTVWILIVLLNNGDAGFTAEFTSKEKCEVAGLGVAAHKLSSYHKMNYFCVEK